MKEDTLSSLGPVKVLGMQPETCGGGRERGDSPALFWHAVIGSASSLSFSVAEWDPPPPCVRPTQGFPCSNLNICMCSGFLMNNSAVADRALKPYEMKENFIRRDCWLACCEEETSAGLVPFSGLPTIRPALDPLQCPKYEGEEGGEG